MTMWTIKAMGVYFCSRFKGYNNLLDANYDSRIVVGVVSAAVYTLTQMLFSHLLQR